MPHDDVAAGAVVALLVGGGGYFTWQITTTRPIVVALNNRMQPGGNGAVVSQPSTSEPWRARFDQVYKLEPAQVVKCVAPPFIPERKNYWEAQAAAIGLLRGMPDSSGLWMTFSYDNAIHWNSASAGKPTIGSALESSVGLRPYQVESNLDLWTVPFPGDLIVRRGASLEQKVTAIEPLLTVPLGGQVHFVKQRATRTAIIMRGTYLPTPSQDFSARRTIDVSIDSVPSKLPSSGTSLEGFCGSLEGILKMKVIDQRSSKQSGTVMYRNNVTPAIARDPQKLRALLENLERQMSLQFTVEPQEIDIWQVSIAASARTQPATPQ